MSSVKQNSNIFTDLRPVKEVALNQGQKLEELFVDNQPFVVRGHVKEWPLVKAGLQSPKAAREYLLERNQGRPFVISIGSPESEGRIFYQENMAVNFQMGKVPLDEIFQRIDQEEVKEKQPIMYLASVDMKAFFNGLAEENTIDLSGRQCKESIWIGMRTRIAAHNDFPDNIACVAVGRRRFTLFPPEQFKNLYIGPVDNTPAGRPISMVDFHHPDYEKFPGFKEALQHAQVVEMEPGDILHIPSLWWHHVEALSNFNILINYWWRETPNFLDQPQNALNHAMLAIRELPDHEKKIWREFFDYYVFNYDQDNFKHIPENGRGILNPMTAQNANKIRSYLLRMLNQ